MPKAVRTVVVTAPALLVVAVAWLRLEQPVASLWRVLALAALASAAAAAPGWRRRAAAALVATVLAGRIAVGVWLVPTQLDPGSGFGLRHAFSAVGTSFANGFSDFYGTHLPFDPRVHVAMGDLVLTGIFTFSLAVALLAAARKPVAAALAALLGAGWPATLLGPSHGIAMGVAILGAALVVLGGVGSRRIPPLALPAAVVVAAAAVAVGSATAARHSLVHWQSWNLTNAAADPTGVSFVWDAQYGGLKWPAHPTVVLKVESAREPSYLRAAVLDDFVGDAWAIGTPRPADALEPAAALRPSNQTSQVVTVEDLADSRLVGGSIPIRFAAGTAPLRVPERGFAGLDQNLPRGFRYTVWSFSPQPTAAELRRSPAKYPPVLAAQGMLDVGEGVTMPAFGAPDRSAGVLRREAPAPELGRYLPLARLAEQVAGYARTPYDAVARVENWFLASGGFRYSNHPLVIQPPLVEFVTQTRVGYCQFYAGAMALMLRYLGIPARVAVGFAGGTYDRHGHAWLVTDRDAHAWVEVWFKGYGWLPFDPTPVASGAAPRPAPAGAGAVAGGGGGPQPGFFRAGRAKAGGTGSIRFANAINRQNGFVSPHGRTSSAASVPSSGGGDRLALLVLLAVVCAGAGAIVLVKVGARFVRRAAREPRRVASACRQELVAFLVDQRIEAPRSATLRELGELMRHEFGVEPAPFVGAATSARFGPLEHAGAAARAARRELRALLDAARRSLTRRERLRGLISLRSLGSTGS